MKIISEGLVKGLLDYLMTRPYQDVEVGIQSLRNLPDMPVAEHKETTAPPKGIGQVKK